MALIPPVIATLIADTKEYMAKMDEAQGKMTEFGAASDAAGSKLSGFASKASTAVIGLGVAFAGVAVDEAMKFQESLDKIQNQAGLTAAQTDALGKSIINISNQTGVAATNIAGAALMVEQAGIKGTNAINLLNAASKAAVATNASVTDTTQALIAAQTLQITKGQSLSKTMGILVAGSKEYVGGLQAEESMLQGRIGVALSNYGLKLQTIVGIGAEFAKVGIPTRSIASFATGIGNLEKPLTDSKGKLTSYAQGIDRAKLSLNALVSDARTSNVVGILTQIKDTAAATGQPLSQVANAVFGTTGGATASVLVKNLQQVAQIQSQIAGSGAGSLNNSFATAMTQLGPQLNVLKANLSNLMIAAGEKLLPAVSDVAKWATDVLDYFKAHPLISKIASDAAIGTFAAAVGYKIVKAMQSAISTISGWFNGTAIEANTAAVQANTAALDARTASGGGSGIGAGEVAGAAGGAEGVLAGASLATVAGGVALMAGAEYGMTKFVNFFENPPSWLGGGSSSNKPSSGANKPKSGGGKVTLKVK